MNTLQVALAAMAMLDQPMGSCVEMPRDPRDSIPHPAKYTPADWSRGPNGNWAKSVGKRKRHLAKKKRERQARRKQRRK